MKVRLISKDQQMMTKIKKFLSTRGYEFAGGSIVEDGGQTTTYIALDMHSAVMSDSLGKQLKDFLGVRKLVLNGLVY